MDNCVDKNISKMLHAYELQALTDVERDIFEQHLLICDFCHEKVKAFLPSAIEIYKDEELMQFAERAASPKGYKKGHKSILDLLWPRAPFLLKPAVLYALMGIAIIAGLLSFDTGGRESGFIKPLQSISLAPLRNSYQPNINISDGADALFQFYVPDGTDSVLYVLKILGEGNTLIYENKEFRLNAENRGLFYINLQSLDPGNYTLSLSVESSDTNIVIYHFNIIE